jgi:DNA end-binding protein Ku
MLVMNTLRWANEIRSVAELDLPAEGKGELSDKELAMAQRLVDDMTEKWKPERYKDTYQDDIMKRIEQRITAGETHAITPVSQDEAQPARGAEVIDLVSMLRRSLDKKGKAANDEEADTAKERPKRAAARKSPSRLAAKKPAAQRKRA